MNRIARSVNRTWRASIRYRSRNRDVIFADSIDLIHVLPRRSGRFTRAINDFALESV
jgi:hypothetical protein